MASKLRARSFVRTGRLDCGYARGGAGGRRLRWLARVSARARTPFAESRGKQPPMTAPARTMTKANQPTANADPPGGRVAIGAALFLGTLLLFARVVGRDFDFVNYDDPDYVTANEHVKAGLSVAGVGWALRANVASNWHPQ